MTANRLLYHRRISGVVFVLLGLASPRLWGAETELDVALRTLLEGVDVEAHIEQRQAAELDGNRYEIRPGDTLDGLLNRIYPQSAIRRDMLRQAVVAVNPQAFRSGNPNWMLAGRTLRLPVAADFLRLIFSDESAVVDVLNGDPASWVRFP